MFYLLLSECYDLSLESVSELDSESVEVPEQ